MTMVEASKSTNQAWTYEERDGIGYLTFNMKGEKVNKFNDVALGELESHLKSIKNVKALVLQSAKPDVFIAGADLEMFEPMLKDRSMVDRVISKGHQVFQMLADAPYPTIAVVDGVCLGGGLECALGCQWIVVTDNPKTSLGLPETGLGIVPGWGGTQRLPRRVGLQQGLKMILTGKPVDGTRAYKIGLADFIINSAFIKESMVDVLAKILSGKAKHRQKRGGLQTFLLEGNPGGRSVVFSMSRKGVLKKTKGQYPAPLIAIDIIQKTYGGSLKRGLEIEKQTFLENVDGAFKIAPNLIRVFFGMERLKKQATPKAKPIHNVGVVGAGVMGHGIAYLSSYKGAPVRMTDVSLEVIAKGLKEIEKTYRTVGKIKRLKKPAINRMIHRISWGTRNDKFTNQDLVIEAATENLNLKHEIFSDIEMGVSDDTIIASNTSSLSIDEMSEGMKNPERFVGMHFFNPVSRMPLVEVVSGSKTSEEAVDTAIALCQKWGKVPLKVKDCAGFLVNRIFCVQASELMRMYEEGAKFDHLEKAMLEFGWPMGPFTLSDQVGNDVTYKVFKSFEKAYGPRFEVPHTFEEMSNRGLYGKKNGKGFYVYDGKKKSRNPDLEVINKLLKRKDRAFTTEEIVERPTLAMIAEAVRCLEEGIVESANDVDMAMILGTGFPPFRGGPLCYANNWGLDNVVERMRHYEKTYGERFTPPKMLLDMVAEGRTFDV
jgi:3-hydroxyacyl-CoA dehydrogenase/enoyl-CoA hydratase/3-hydroxybutyryl-CoA epimerase